MTVRFDNTNHSKKITIDDKNIYVVSFSSYMDVVGVRFRDKFINPVLEISCESVVMCNKNCVVGVDLI